MFGKAALSQEALPLLQLIFAYILLSFVGYSCSYKSLIVCLENGSKLSMELVEQLIILMAKKGPGPFKGVVWRQIVQWT